MKTITDEAAESPLTRAKVKLRERHSVLPLDRLKQTA